MIHQDTISPTRLKGLAKPGNNVAEANFAACKQENDFASAQKNVCFPDTNFASETCFSVNNADNDS